MKDRLETPFKGDNEKALIKRQIVKNWSFISRRKFRKLQHLLCFFSGFHWPNNRLKMVLACPNDQKYPHYPLIFKLSITLARPLRLVIHFFKWKFLSDVRRFYLHDSKWNSRSEVDGLSHTKQLLNLLCIVYFIAFPSHSGRAASAFYILKMVVQLRFQQMLFSVYNVFSRRCFRLRFQGAIFQQPCFQLTTFAVVYSIDDGFDCIFGCNAAENVVCRNRLLQILLNNVLI